jgi:D-inositol-3-phosphate glycosyltransferase
VKDESLRIAVISVHASPIGDLGTMDVGGMSVFIREVAKELGARGHKVDIFSRLSDGGSSGRIDLSENVRLLGFSVDTGKPLRRAALYPHLPAFSQEVEDLRASENLHYDIVHSHYWLSGRVGTWLRERWTSSHVTTFHTLGAVTNMTVGRDLEPDLRIKTEQAVIDGCDRILAFTETERSYLMECYKAPHGKIGVIPCGVDMDLFRPTPKGSARIRVGFDQDETIVLYVGRFAPPKGIERLLRAFSRLEYRQLRLAIIGGDGDGSAAERKLRGLSAELGIEERVTFLGRIEHEQLPHYYSAADFLVLPSHYESFGLVALESMACGTPVVATCVGAMQRVVGGDGAGRIVENGTSAELAQGMMAFLSSEHRSSAEAVRSAVLQFSWKNVADAVIEEYRNVLRRGNRRGTNSRRDGRDTPRG